MRLIAGCLLVAAAAASTHASPKPRLTPGERWVLERTLKGEIADLAEEPGCHQSRCPLSADFVLALIKGELGALTQYGIRIVHAEIATDLKLNNVAIDRELLIDESHVVKINARDFTAS